MSEDIRFDNQVAVVTGAGSGLGRAYAILLASRGASVVVNDIGSKAADAVVNSIIAAGGKAVANSDSVEHGSQIIDTAISNFNRIDILINNAGITRDVTFKNMNDKDWDDVIATHVNAVYQTTHAAWPYFRKQKYGRVINTSSASGLYGNFGQTNYSAAKMALIGFTETLAKEGIKNNILCNVIAPSAGTQMTASLASPEILEHLKPEWVSPVVALLVHPSNQETGSIFEVGGRHVSKIRWQRAKGALLRCDESMTPGSVLEKWNDLNDFSTYETPTTTQDLVAKLRESAKLPPNNPGKPLRFDGRVAVVTGGGAGSSVEDGEAVIKTAIDEFGRVDILINNAGILRDKSFANMTKKQWDEIMGVHLGGTYKCTKAAYPYMLKQKYGRIVNTTSTSGTYGNFGQSNYAAAKCGILGFSRALALEGFKHNIYVNIISPSAGTQLTSGVLPEEVVKSRKPDYVAPLVALLCSDHTPDPTGRLYEAGCGWQARVRWQRSGGYTFPAGVGLTPEVVGEKWHSITDFGNNSDSPETMADGRKRVMAMPKLERGESRI